MHQLYLVATPIGNLEDITLRALRTLKEVSLIAAEDTRKTGFLLAHYQITTPMTSFHDHSQQTQLDKLITALESGDVALVSDAGMPGLSDPGYLVVQAAVTAGFRVTPIPGATAAISALVVSNLPTNQFYFLGFLPRKSKARQDQLRQVATIQATLVLYESPHRILSLLEDIQTVLGTRTITIGRELTKMHEEIWRGSVADGITYFSSNKIRGEFTVVVAGASTETAVWSQEKVEKRLTALLLQGDSPRAAAMTLITPSGWRKKQLYQLALDLDNKKHK